MSKIIRKTNWLTRLLVVGSFVFHLMLYFPFTLWYIIDATSFGSHYNPLWLNSFAFAILSYLVLEHLRLSMLSTDRELQNIQRAYYHIHSLYGNRSETDKNIAKELRSESKRLISLYKQRIQRLNYQSLGVVAFLMLSMLVISMRRARRADVEFNIDPALIIPVIAFGIGAFLHIVPGFFENRD
jgi:hypothetical protein